MTHPLPLPPLGALALSGLVLLAHAGCTDPEFLNQDGSVPSTDGSAARDAAGPPPTEPPPTQPFMDSGQPPSPPKPPPDAQLDTGPANDASTGEPDDSALPDPEPDAALDAGQDAGQDAGDAQQPPPSPIQATALRFDGFNDQVRAFGPADPAGPFTLVWIGTPRFKETSTLSPIWRRSGAATAAQLFLDNGSKEIALRVFDTGGGVDFELRGAADVAETLSTLVLRSDPTPPGRVDVWVNGQQVATREQVADLSEFVAVFGEAPGAFIGDIFEVATYDASLTDPQLAEIQAYVRARFEEGESPAFPAADQLSSHLRADSCDGEPMMCSDLSGNATGINSPSIDQSPDVVVVEF